MARQLTKKLIEAALAIGAGDKPYVMIWDAVRKGLGLRIRRSGGASWLYRYRPRNALRGTAVKTLTLGTWPQLSIEGARSLALGHAARIALGNDPSIELQQQKLRQRSTIGAALEDYELALNRRHIVNRKTVMATLRKGFAPVSANEIETLGLRNVVALVDRIATTRRKRKDGTAYVTPGAAADFRKHAHGFLNWAALQGLVAANVLAGHRAQKASREEKLLRKVRQGRALDDREIVAVWTAARDMGSFGALVQASLLTALRRSELAGLRWTDIRDGVIVIAEGRTKMGREHRVPISSMMQALLAALPRPAPGGLVFPSPVTGNALAGWSKLLPKLNRASGVRFRLHDCRRSCRTNMARCGIAEAVAEAAIGHVRRGLLEIYDKHDLWTERVQAFEAVSAHMSTLLAKSPHEAGNVVKFTKDRP